MTDELIGTQLGQYHLIEHIAHGGMAAVYKAHQPSLDRFVAIKVMLHNRDPQFPARFKREARAIAQLQHPNILPIYDYGEQDGLLYLVLQYVENGITLTQRMGAPMQPEAALRLTSRLLGGLEYAHSRGIIHRDIKPGNVLMPAPEWPMLSDFGIAKLLNDNTQAQLTVPGLVVGTAAYMAPEQALAHPVDARTDLYATGIILYEMLTGRVPFDAEQPVVVLTQHVYETPPPPTQFNPSIPPPVERAVLRALAKKPNERYQSATEMAAALDEVSIQIRKPDTRSQITSLYQAGVLAFAEGRWDQAVDQLGKLVTLDPEYEDGADLLVAAQEARERARQEAREQIERVRQRRSTMAQSVGETTRMPSPATGETTRMPSPATGETTRMPPLPPTSETARLIEEPPAQQPTPPTLQETAPTAPAQGVVAEPEKSAPLAPAQVHVPSDAVTPAVQTSAAVTQAPVSSAAQAPAAATPKPASGRSLAIAGAVAVLLLLAVGGTFAAGLWSGDQSAMAPTSAPATSAPATSAPAQSGETAAPATEAPEQATEAPPPAELPPPIGDIAFEEDFSAGGQRNGLDDQVPDTEFSRGFHSPGVYHFRAAKPNETRWVVMPRQMYAEFTMQLEAWDFSDEFVGGVAQGVIFRVRDSDHFYAFLLDPRAGRYTVRKHDGPDQWTDIIPWKESPLVKRGVEVNTIRVDGKGGDFTIFLNGQQAETFTDSSFERGMLGMIIANGDANAPHMHFDNMSVWSEDAAPQASSLEPTRETPAGTMVLIPGGEFVLGSNDRSDTPPHIVGLPDFYIDTSEVTNRNYETCVGDGACTPPQSPASQSHPNYATQEEYADYPVMHVSWEQANQFCQWAGKRLPTEAEWEKAAAWSAAANAKTAWPFGNEFDPALLNSAESNTGDTTAAGAYPPEVNGTFDMAGNVAEWTSSLYKPYPYDPSDGREDPEASGERILRGGSWAQTKGKALSALRLPVAPDYFDREIGFRCAITP